MFSIFSHSIWIAVIRRAIWTCTRSCMPNRKSPLQREQWTEFVLCAPCLCHFTRDPSYWNPYCGVHSLEFMSTTPFFTILKSTWLEYESGHRSQADFKSKFDSKSPNAKLLIHSEVTRQRWSFLAAKSFDFYFFGNLISFAFSRRRSRFSLFWRGKNENSFGVYQCADRMAWMTSSDNAGRT